jgi:hypothetical protein
MILATENQSIRNVICPITTLPTANLIWTGLGWTPPFPVEWHSLWDAQIVTVTGHVQVSCVALECGEWKAGTYCMKDVT